MGESRSKSRHKWRLPCEIVFEGGRQRSFVLDLSETGLFVQTTARLHPGSEVQVRLTLAGAAAPLVLRTRVARSKRIPAQLASVAPSGVGLHLCSAPKEYLDALATLREGAEPRAKTTPERNVASAVSRRFLVQVKQSDGPRTRRLEIRADSAGQAQVLALRETGAGWEVVGAETAPG